MLLQSFRVIYYYYRVIQYNINVQNIQNIQLGCFISLSDTLKQFAFGNWYIVENCVPWMYILLKIYYFVTFKTYIEVQRII